MRIQSAYSELYVADTETTGLDYGSGDRIVEFAARRMGDGAELAMLVNPGRTIPVTASAIHHLTDAHVANAPSLEEAYAYIASFIPEGAIVAFHNAAFDMSMLPCLSGRRVLCTKRLAQHLLPDAPGFSNQALRYYLGGAHVDLRGIAPHRALADVLVTQFVLTALMGKYLVAGHPDDIDAMLALAESPIEYRNFPFGKHRNEPLGVARADYIEWMLRTEIDADLRHSLRAELARREVAA